MFPKEIEVILARQLASYLAMPIFIVDVDGNLVFYNESAELILGRRYDEAGEMSAQEWGNLFSPTDEYGTSLDPQDLPLMIAVRAKELAFRRFWIRSLDGKARGISVTAFPLVGQANRFLGAMAIFWEEKEQWM